MSKAWPKVRLGELLKRSVETIKPVVDAEYREITVRLWGKGVIERGLVTGSELSGRRFIARVGQFIASRIDARNGAMGLVTPMLDGALVTNDFPLFWIDCDRLEPSFLAWLCRTEGFVELCQRASEGTTNRIRLQEDRFLTLEISIPHLVEQQRIVARIEEIASQIHDARSLREQTAEEAETLGLLAAAEIFPAPSGGIVGNWIRFQTGYAFKSEWFTEDGIRLVRNANIGHGTINWNETIRLPELQRSVFPDFELQVGDILISLDRPIISTGVKVARVCNADIPCLLLQRVARAQYRDKSVLPDYFFHWLRSPHFVNAIDPGRSNGVPHISHKDIEKIPFAVPRLPEQHRIVSYLNALHSEVNTLKRLQAESAAELDALLPALIDRAFKGEL